MATRCNIVIEYGATKLFIYRHWDGYPAETGADLVEKLTASRGDAEKFVRALLAEVHEKQSYEDAARSVYEVTSEIHGDIEWVYAIRFEPHGGTIVEASAVEVSLRGDRDGDAAYAMARSQLGPISGLISKVNADRTESNRRIEAMKRANRGNPHYADMGLYEMVAGS